MNRLENHFNYVINYDLLARGNFINVMQTPKIDKIVLNSGLGQKAVIASNKKHLINILLGLELISGQKAKITRAKKSVDKFKLRKNMPLGGKVTLRKQSLFLFLEKLTCTVLPRYEDPKELYQKLQNKKALQKEQGRRQRPMQGEEYL